MSATTSTHTLPSFQSPATLRMRSPTQLPPIEVQPPLDNDFYDCFSPLLHRRKSKKASPAPSSTVKMPYQTRFFEHLPGCIPPDLRSSPSKPRLFRHNSAPVSKKRPWHRRVPSFARVDEEDGELPGVVTSDVVVDKEHAPLSGAAVNRAARSGSLAREIAAQKQAIQKLKEVESRANSVPDVTPFPFGNDSKLSIVHEGKASEPKGFGRIRRATLQLKEKMRPPMEHVVAESQH